jgi:hypothetical protein
LLVVLIPESEVIIDRFGKGFPQRLLLLASHQVMLGSTKVLRHVGDDFSPSWNIHHSHDIGEHPRHGV